MKDNKQKSDDNIPALRTNDRFRTGFIECYEKCIIYEDIRMLFFQLNVHSTAYRGQNNGDTLQTVSS